MNKRYPERPKLLGYILGEKGNIELTNSLDALAEAARRFRDRGISTLAINGGDGTISRTLTAFILAYGEKPLPRILILRGGTINLLALNLGISGAPEAILVRFMESLSGLQSVEYKRFSSLEVNGHYGFLFGNGLSVNFLKEFYKRKSGPLGAVFLIIKVYFWFFLSQNRYLRMIRWRKFRMVLDQGAVDLGTRGTVGVMASTVSRMPLGPKLFPLAIRSGTFQFFSLELSPNRLLWTLPLALLRNSPGRWFGKVSHLTRSLSLESDDQKNQEYTIDGELFDAQNGKLEVKIGPSIEFIVV